MTRQPASRLGQHAHAQRIFEILKGGIVAVLETWSTPQHRDPEFLVPMAQLVEQGGASAILVDSVPGLAAIRHAIAIPIIAADRNRDAGDRVIFTPSIESASVLVKTGARIVVVTATSGHRPAGDDLVSIVEVIHAGRALAFGLIDTAADLAGAFEAGFDAIGTWQPRDDVEPDLALQRWLVRHSAVPVFGGGTLWSPNDARDSLEAGAAFVMVGEAITNPAAIAARFVIAAQRRT